MSRRRQEAAEQAAMQASEAGRILQAQRQAKEEVETPPERVVEGERPPVRNEPRRRGMEEIEQRDLQTKGLAEPKEEPQVETPQDPPPPTPEQMLEGGKFSEAPPEQQTETVAEQVEVQPETVRVKVDGEEFDVPKAEVDEYGGVKAYQIAKAAENRLKKASETVAETKRMQDALQRFLQAQVTPQPQAQSPAEILKQKIDIIRYGTPEESAAAFQEALEKLNPRVDQNAITQAAVMKMQQSLAVERFKDEYSDVMQNPLLMKLAVTLEQERLGQMMKEGHTPEWSSFYKQLGNEIRSLVKPAQQNPAPTSGTPSQVSSDKEARKASIVNLPTASQRAELPKESKPETRADVLNQMRKTRGLPTG